MDSTNLQPPGNYPDNWQRTDFDHFTTLKRGKDLTRDQFREGRVPVAGSNGVIGYHDTANVKAPGVTVGRSGSVGRVTYYTTDFWAHNTALFVTDFHGNDPRFTAYFLDSLKLGRFGSGVSVPTLDRNVFRMLPVVAPPLDEQRKIAGVLEVVQRAMEQQERLLALTAELKRALLHQLFTAGLRGEPQKQTDLGPVPESWEVVELGKIAELINGFAFKSEDYLPQGILNFRVVNIREEGVIDVAKDTKFLPDEFTRSHKQYLLCEGDILVVMVGATRGKMAYVSTAVLPALMNRNMWRIVPVASGETHRRYLYHFLTTAVPAFVRDFSESARGFFKKSDFRAIKVPKPTFNEQREIAETIDTVEQKMRNHEARLSCLHALFRTLLHQLMTAQLRVRDLDVEGLLAQVEREVGNNVLPKLRTPVAEMDRA